MSTTVRARFLRVLDAGVEGGDLTHGEAMDLLAKCDDWPMLLDRLSQRTRGKWQAEDERDRLIRAIERLRDTWLTEEGRYHAGLPPQRPTNSITLIRAATQVGALLPEPAPQPQETP